MDDLNKYIENRFPQNTKARKSFEVGYENFKIGIILRQARENAGLTQEEVARLLNTKKSAISRIENHAEDIKLSTLGKYATAIGKKFSFQFI
ncbi:MAG: helix-turn-helix domain-containing protein [Planctomycetia bacterium]|nr:helix-turn-helix domain-containing protein [Planctomycetia bacterium]